MHDIMADKETVARFMKTVADQADMLAEFSKALGAIKEVSAEKEELYALQTAVKKLKEKTTDGFNKVKDSINKGSAQTAEIFPTKDNANLEDVEEMVRHGGEKLQKAIDQLASDNEEKIANLEQQLQKGLKDDK